MTFYRIEEADLPAEKHSYYVYQGLQELEVQLNTGFTAVRDLLECVHSQLSAGKSVIMHIAYIDEQIKYYVQCDSAELLDVLIQSTPRLRWTKERQPFDAAFAADKVTLAGSASPLILKERDDNPVDELIRLAGKEPFLIQIKLGVADSDHMSRQMSLLQKHINEISKEAEKQVGEQGNLGEHLRKLFAGGENLSYQQTNASAKQQMEILQNHLYMLTTQGGIFASSLFHIYGSKKTAPAIASHLERTSRRSGSLSLYRLRKGQTFTSDYLNFASVNGVASLIALPMKPTPGLKLNVRATFGAEAGETADGKRIELGKLMTSYHTNIPVSVPLSDLTKHMFISGVTGSGKTSTVKSMLVQAVRNKVPFLVLEPAKTEYKYLDAQVPSLRRFTLGIEGSLSFKINPFEFPAHVHIQTHLDHLKSVFTAAFPMYGPMPYILETSFYHIYRRAGWDFVSGRNIFEGTLERADLFPTLEDLYMAIDQAIEAAGYSADLSSDIRGALKVRIGSLLSGSKGTMLNTRESHSVASLLQSPTIMELEYIGDDQEKVFLMGLLLIAIYEHYVSEARPTGELKHLLVIEEAHRLLENTRPSGNQEVADMKGKAVEAFNNMLSEIRAYGQGLIVADQIPTKLSPDIIKNTNMKIVHRLYAKDDRQVLGDSMGLSEEQMNELLRLKQGEAVVFHGKADAPMKVSIEVDRSILAEDQQESRRPEKIPLVLENYLLQDDSFLKTIFRLMNTYLLFPEAEDRMNEELKREIRSAAPGILSAEPDLQRLWAMAIERYYKHTRLFERVAHPVALDLIRGVESSGDPLAFFAAWAHTALPLAQSKHKMARFSSLFERYRFFRTVSAYREDRLSGVIAKIKEGLHYENAALHQLLLKQSETGALVRTDLLSAEQKKQLTYAMMLYEFEDYSSLLEAYFDIRSVEIAGTVRSK
ncbi:ATP-binding protein [Paenibacillus thermotolerans]|uniref:ATP-binding protein n=1 Tax=Paenibacillus thermotolerans TaxID=3027807 RepID=UPI0023685977|nr:MULTISPECIES: ATP-binding protein [unclassified Paenibacillus]